jgi:hypothetical protein
MLVVVVPQSAVWLLAFNSNRATAVDKLVATITLNMTKSLAAITNFVVPSNKTRNYYIPNICLSFLLYKDKSISQEDFSFSVLFCPN